MDVLRPARLLAATLTVAAAAAAPADGQTELRRIRVLGGQSAGAELYEVRAAAFSGHDLVVLSGGVPALHLFEGTRHRAWGARGRGPAELTGPQNAVWSGSRILVRDGELQKIATYDRAGNFIQSRPLNGAMAVRLEMAGRDTLVELFGQQTRTVVRLRGARQDTVLRFAPATEMVRLAAPGAPTLTLPAPFAGQPAWAALPDGRIAFWDGQEQAIRLLDLSGRPVGRLPLPATRYAVTAADREAWFANAIPTQIRGQQVFEPLRQVARSEVRFPSHFPMVMALRADPAGGVWVLQSGTANGQRWVHVAAGQAPTRIQLPPRQSLLAFGEHEIAALARDADDVESVHVYAHPLRRTARR
jgi:hypothetical protein